MDTAELKARAKLLRSRGLYDGLAYHMVTEELWWRTRTHASKGWPAETVAALSDHESLSEALEKLSVTEQLRSRLLGKSYRENRIPDFYECAPRDEPCLTPRQRSEQRLQSRIESLKGLTPSQRATQSQHDEGTRRIMREHDIPDRAWSERIVKEPLTEKPLAELRATR
jgi:hypothetical protein